MPPSGVTAIVEYLHPTEAKTGFTRLAYTKVSIKFILKIYNNVFTTIFYRTFGRELLKIIICKMAFNIKLVMEVNMSWIVLACK